MNNVVLILFIIVPILALLLLGLNKLLSLYKPNESKVSSYECGFLPHLGQTRIPFQIHYYLTGMLFLIFDMEILLLFPISNSLNQISVYGFSIGVLFFTILTIGFILELSSGAIGLTEISNNNVTKNNITTHTNTDTNTFFWTCFATYCQPCRDAKTKLRILILL